MNKTNSEKILTYCDNLSKIKIDSFDYYKIINPYNDCKILTFSLGDMVEEYIGILNNAFDNKKDEYITVNVFEAFKNEEYVTNADIMKLDFDPHPNSKGHKIIADLFVEAIKKDLN